ncbi:MAG: YncE family protein [Flavobacteriales bacterium]|nr:YncE family protein [Flavobacteriales bacterium]
MSKVAAFISLIILVLGACTKEDGIGAITNETEYTELQAETKTVFVINEGNFQWGNSSITYYNIDSSIASQNVFEEVNGTGLGDVAQSMVIHNEKGYIVVDNSSKIEVVDIKTFESVGTINGLVAPRYIQIINDNKAYVTDIYADYISIFDPESMVVTGQVDIMGHTEAMVLVNDKVYITNSDTSSVYGNRVYVVDANTDEEITNFEVAKSPNSAVLDANGKVWVLSSGGYEKEIPELIQIDPSDNSIIQTFAFPSLADSPNKLKINGTGDTLYYLNGGVFNMSIYNAILPATEFIDGDGHLFYGLGVDPNGGDIYVADAIDYVQKGRVYTYGSSSGTLINSFASGIIPGDFAFR